MLCFIETIARAKLNGTYLKLLSNIARCQLLVLDDWGWQPMDHTTKMALMQILEDRWAKGAIVITSQLPVKNWYGYIEEPTVADAIMDRLTAKSHKIELIGESLRKN
jgi:DNA replication protein DnaC